MRRPCTAISASRSPRARQLKGALGRLPPLLTGLRGRPPGLADRRGLRRRHVVGCGHGWVPGQAALHVFLDAGEMTDQALHVQVTQRGPRPVRVGQLPQQLVEGAGRAAISLIGGDWLRHRIGTARRPREQGGRDDTFTQAGGHCRPGGQRRRALFARHDDSKNSRSSIVSSLARASRRRDLAVPSGIPAAFAASRQVSPPK